MIPTRYWPSDVRCSSCQEARSTAIRWVVDTGSPVSRAISVTEWLRPVRKVERIAVILLTADRGGGSSWLGTTRLHERSLSGRPVRFTPGGRIQRVGYGPTTSDRVDLVKSRARSPVPRG